MIKLPFYVLLLPAMSLSAIALSNDSSKTLDCNGLFASLIENEPILKDELGALKTSCESEQSSQRGTYWSCVHARMQSGKKSFERFIVSTNVCDDLS
ncbi:hypothetical protein NBRC116188_09480 [Oceaniserpentilla sp. 4NH20-0058]|uniref:hypothetical protein n=1 Tax=Oceaniserpentilla sp. 4NH20-0058 TaxID=3127660 RepID=UPI0031088698